MSDLTSIEKLKLERLLNMRTGYVLDFSNRTFHEFILENTGLDIYEDKYNYGTGSKANRLRAFWDKEPNYITGKLTSAFLEFWKTQKLIESLEISTSEQILFDECFHISERLMQDGRTNEDMDEVTTNVHFSQIQSNIIEQIELAKFTIWVAVAWFTDGELFKHLLIKKNQGVNVQLIIIDDEINNNSGLNYENNFETYRVTKVGNYENIMHNKFCIIDIKTVIHGSYNWTKKARYNKETVTVTNSREVAEQFSEQFIELKRSARLYFG